MLIAWLAVSLLCTLPLDISAQSVSIDVHAPATVPTSARWEIRSSKGRPYRVQISRPLQEAPPEGYPVLYVLDGNSNFGTVTDTLRTQGRRPDRTGISAALVVAIGYPTDDPYDNARRGYDYVVLSPGANSPKHGQGGHLEPDAGGGADDFLDFILDELRPAVEQAYPVDRGRQTLMGHSFGGFFTLYTLFTRPQSFQNYLALSPSVWWNQYSIFDEQARFLASRSPRDPPVSLFLAVGDLEESEQIPMVSKIRDLVERMQAATGSGVKTEFFVAEGEDHGSIVPTTISRALRSRIGDGFEADPPVARQ